MVAFIRTQAARLWAIQKTLAEEPAPSRTPLTLLDGLFALTLALLGACVALWGLSLTGPTLSAKTAMNIWFQADSYRVLQNMTDMMSDHYRTAVHPLSSLIVSPIVMGMMKLGVGGYAAAGLGGTGASGLMAGLFFIALRFLGLPRLVAFVFALLLPVSAGFMYWAGFVELYSWSGLSVTLLLLALAYGRTKNRTVWVLACMAALSLVVTNGILAVCAVLTRWPLGRSLKRSPAAQILAAALLLVSLGALVQPCFFRNAWIFFDVRHLIREGSWTQPVQAYKHELKWTPMANLRSVWVTTVIAPPVYQEKQKSDWVVTNQRSQPGESLPMEGVIAAGGWVVLLGLGIWGGLRSQAQRPVTLALLAMMASQSVLHVVYGEVTFLYAMDHLPILLMLAAMGWFSPRPRFALSLAAILVGCLALSNAATFHQATDLAHTLAQQALVADAQQPETTTEAPAP